MKENENVNENEENYLQDDDKQVLLLDESKENKENKIDYVKSRSKTRKKTGKKSKKLMTVTKHDSLCEPNAHIKKIVTLQYSSLKIFFFIFLNISTFGMINLILSWHPILKIDLLFKKVPIEISTHVGLFCYDGNFYIEKLNKKKIPNIENSHLQKYILSYLPITKSVIFIFDFKHFRYIYNEEEGRFNSVSFKIKAKRNEIINIFGNSLTQKEIDFLSIIFGKNEIMIKTPHFIRLLYNELKSGFYLYQLIVLVYWIHNDYKIYAFIILSLTIFYAFLGAIISNKNLVDIKKINFENEVNVYVKYTEEDTKDKNKKETKVKKILMSNKDLVPGMVYEIPAEVDAIVPCDSILLYGNVIVNESMFTGVPVATLKTALEYNEKEFYNKKHYRNMLYYGTNIKKIRAPESRVSNTNLYLPDNKPRALVLATSFMSSKGDLVRSIIYTEKIKNKFSNDSNKILYMMTFLSIIGVIICVPFLLKHKLSKHIIIVQCFDLIPLAVPPIFPICFFFIIYISIIKLKKKNIICINKNKLNEVGEINTICFDKTRTLTEDYFDISGYQPICFINNKAEFDDFSENCDTKVLKGYNYYKKKINNKKLRDRNEDVNQLFIECMGCCHNVTQLNNKLVGDMIDIKMFEAIKWHFKEYNYDNLIKSYVMPPQEKELSNVSDSEDKIMNELYMLGILKIYNFSSYLQRMSVIVKNINEKNYKIFTKGSPEAIKNLCRKETIPNNFYKVLNIHTSKGDRALGLACKQINTNILNLDSIPREKLESDMYFLGFIIIRNKIKTNVKETIHLLNQADYKMIVSTGDNLLTAISVSKECELIPNDKIMYSIDIDKNNMLMTNLVENYSDFHRLEITEEFDEIRKQIEEGKVSSEYSQDFNEENDDNVNEQTLIVNSNLINSKKLNKKNLTYFSKRKAKIKNNKKTDNYININISKIPFDIQNPLKNTDKIIVINGETFTKFWKLRNKYLETKNEEFLIHYNTFRYIIHNCYVYASMNPEEKKILIESLIQEKYSVCMVGGSYNDSGALKSANIGISLNPNDISSIAAPFTSKNSDIRCVVDLLLEGKAYLVTSIQVIKFIILFAFIQLISTIILLIIGSNLNQNQYFVTDLFIMIPIIILFSITDTKKKLTNETPSNSLINYPLIFSLIFQMILVVFFQILSLYILKREKWYKFLCIINDDFDEGSPCYDNTVIFVISSMQYFITFLVFSINYPFKKNIFKNELIIIFLLIFVGYSLMLIIRPDKIYFNILKMTYIPSYIFRFILLIVCAMNFICSYLCENYLVRVASRIFEY